MGLTCEIADLEGTGLDLRALRKAEEQAGAAAPDLASAGFGRALDSVPPLPAQTRLERVVVLGIGGSALGTRAVHLATRTASRRPVLVLDNVDPDAVEAAWEAGDPERTAWVVVSKSGGTTEILAQWAVVRGRLDALGARPEIHVVTGARGPLRELAVREGLPVHEVPEEVGGRFSVFTPAATVPLALAGHDTEALLRGAREAREHCCRSDGMAARLAALLCTAAAGGRNVVTLWSYAERLETVGEWFRQLWAESLGKRRGDGSRAGQTPLHCVGSTDQHSIQQLMVEGPPDKAVLVLTGPGEPGSAPNAGLDAMLAALRHEPYAEARGRLATVLSAMRRATSAEMVRAGCPCATLRLDGWEEESLGGLLMVLLCATVLAGGLLGVDPYGQPGVEAAKRATKQLLADPGGAEDRAIARLLGEGRGIRCP